MKPQEHSLKAGLFGGLPGPCVLGGVNTSDPLGPGPLTQALPRATRKMPFLVPCDIKILDIMCIWIPSLLIVV